MRFAPRYSLTFLLLLTAVAAVGAKWWRGPHRVVERHGPDNETELTFTADLWGAKTLEGPRIWRMGCEGRHLLTSIRYYRAGEWVSRFTLKLWIDLDRSDRPILHSPNSDEFLATLTNSEATRFRETVAEETQRLELAAREP